MRITMLDCCFFDFCHVCQIVMLRMTLYMQEQGLQLYIYQESDLIDKNMDNNGQENPILGAYVNYLIKERQNHQEIIQDVEMKKAYLEEHVINYYSKEQQKIHRFAELFKIFIKEQKGIVVEERILDHVTLWQLREFIKNFRSHFPPSKIKQSIIELNEDNEDDLSVKNSNEQIHNNFSAEKVKYKNGAWDYYISGYEECKRYKKIFDIEKDKQDYVTFGKCQVRKSGGFLGIGSKLQLWMQITNKMTMDTVWRKAQDFIFIKNILHSFFPFRYIPVLDISQKQLLNVQDPAKSQSILKKCQHFISSICKQSYFIQNKYVFRFFKEKKYDNYMEHKSMAIQQPINKIKDIQNEQGFIQLQISQNVESIKLDYMKKGLLLQKFWNNLSIFNGRIIQSFKNVEKQLINQQKQFQKVMAEFQHIGTLVSSQKYNQFSNTISMYNDIFNSCEEKIKNYRSFFHEINYKVSQNHQIYWKGFNEYSKGIFQRNNEYCQKRKFFQQKWAKKSQQSKQQTNKGGNIDPVNKSILKQMGIYDNDTKQFVWIERYSKWQGFANTQYKFSFNRLFQDNLAIFTDIMRKNYKKLIHQK